MRNSMQLKKIKKNDKKLFIFMSIWKTWLKIRKNKTIVEIDIKMYIH
jgi:hypothetical protein